jgi:hypothetical protein
MSTSDSQRSVTELARTEGDTLGRWLADRPQPLGLLPTWWFWNERRNWRLIMGLVIPTMLVVTAIVDLLGAGTLALALTPALVVTGMLGLIERYVRGRLVSTRSPAAEPG